MQARHIRDLISDVAQIIGFKKFNWTICHGGIWTQMHCNVEAQYQCHEQRSYYSTLLNTAEHKQIYSIPGMYYYITLNLEEHLVTCPWSEDKLLCESTQMWLIWKVLTLTSDSPCKYHLSLMCFEDIINIYAKFVTWERLTISTKKTQAFNSA